MVMIKGKRLSQYHPILYRVAVFKNRFFRYLEWYFGKKKYAKEISDKTLDVRLKKHQSLLLRTLGNVNMELQHNKVKNLTLATNRINGILIHPGETFSLWKLLGNCTKRKGYLKGLVLSNGEAKTGIGGGLCQLANLIHWMVLHSPLKVTERHHHSLDVFPDSGRTVPFGSGASIYYNYLDYQVTNDTPYTFQICVWVTDQHLKGELLCSEQMPYSYHILEKNHRFFRKEDVFYRENEIWREVIDRFSGKSIDEELLYHNIAKVMYDEEHINQWEESC